ncbi:hypothetical protein HMY34_05310 [Thiothrix subterranea]|uniref:hypothetical protein n=1 Tax=Thiothrix subterranea TaxID=2735563 RepID=UPI00192CBEE9|nr:hypothetical protein [Thiothrix subterranea]QQZ28219.1 hypothetical protein HMY34_05310 [Thiothrix subterranea]
MTKQIFSTCLAISLIASNTYVCAASTDTTELTDDQSKAVLGGLLLLGVATTLYGQTITRAEEADKQQAATVANVATISTVTASAATNNDGAKTLSGEENETTPVDSANGTIWTSGTYSDGPAEAGKKCKFAMPLGLLGNANLFKHPIAKNDIINSYAKRSWWNYECVNGYMESPDLTMRIELHPSYKQKTHLPLPSEKYYPKSFLQPLGISLSGKMEKGMYTGDVEISFLDTLESGSIPEIRRVPKENLSYLLNENYKIISDNSDYFDLKAYADGKNNYFLDRGKYVEDGLGTSNPARDYFNIDTKLQSGKSEKFNINDPEFFGKTITSNMEKEIQDVNLLYSVKPKNLATVKGKKYKITLVFDMKLEYALTSNMKVIGINPVTLDIIPKSRTCP